jgi:hypothetical protein
MLALQVLHTTTTKHVKAGCTNWSVSPACLHLATLIVLCAHPPTTMQQETVLCSDVAQVNVLRYSANCGVPHHMC